jgi:hypothetical protein
MIGSVKIKMNKLKRIFKKEVKGKSLDDLAVKLDVPLNLYKPVLPLGYSTKVYGNINFIAKDADVKVELDITMKYYNNKKYSGKSVFEFKKQIPYNKVG